MTEETVAHFHSRLSVFQPTIHAHSRGMALFAGSVAVASTDSIAESIRIGRTIGLSRSAFYELILQSYLFLGFPRMLTAMDVLNQVWPETRQPSLLGPVTPVEGQNWYDDGIRLCEQVYAQNYSALKQRVEAMAPEIFRWMILEGYGKVLSRPGVTIIDRELAIVAMLMIDQREKQLHSHIKGAFNVGAEKQLIQAVVEDIGDAAGIGYEMAQRILERIGGQ